MIVTVFDHNLLKRRASKLRNKSYETLVKETTDKLEMIGTFCGAINVELKEVRGREFYIITKSNGEKLNMMTNSFQESSWLNFKMNFIN